MFLRGVIEIKEVGGAKDVKEVGEDKEVKEVKGVKDNSDVRRKLFARHLSLTSITSPTTMIWVLRFEILQVVSLHGLDICMVSCALCLCMANEDIDALLEEFRSTCSIFEQQQ